MEKATHPEKINLNDGVLSTTEIHVGSISNWGSEPKKSNDFHVEDSPDPCHEDLPDTPSHEDHQDLEGLYSDDKRQLDLNQLADMI